MAFIVSMAACAVVSAGWVLIFCLYGSLRRAEARASAIEADAINSQTQNIVDASRKIPSNYSGLMGLVPSEAFRTPKKCESIKGAKLCMAKVMGGGKVLTVGVMRDREGLETTGKTPCGSVFLFGENGELIASQPKGKELSIWSQC